MQVFIKEVNIFLSHWKWEQSVLHKESTSSGVSSRNISNRCLQYLSLPSCFYFPIPMVLDNSEKFPSNVYRLEKSVHVFIAAASSQHPRESFVFFKVFFFLGGGNVEEEAGEDCCLTRHKGIFMVNFFFQPELIPLVKTQELQTRCPPSLQVVLCHVLTSALDKWESIYDLYSTFFQKDSCCTGIPLSLLHVAPTFL